MRKAWRVDLKWIFGIIFTISCFMFLNAYFFLGLTSVSNLPQNAADPTQAQKGNYGIPGFNYNPLQKFYDDAKADPEKNISIPGIGELDLKGKDITGLSPDETAKVMERAVNKKVASMSEEDIEKIADNIKLPQMAEDFAKDPAQSVSKMFTGDSGLFSGLSPYMFAGPIAEGICKTIMGIAGFFMFISLIGLLFTSYRSGKLTSVGNCLIIASLPGFTGYILGKSYIGVAGPTASIEAPSVPLMSFLTVIGEKGTVFPIAFGLGIFLIFIGFIVGIIMLAVRPKTAAVPAPAPQKEVKVESKAVNISESPTEKIKTKTAKKGASKKKKPTKK